MKIKTQKEIGEIARKQFCLDEYPNNHWLRVGYVDGYTQAQKDLIESASEGFEEWNGPRYERLAYAKGCIEDEDYDVKKKAWQASKLSQGKEIGSLREEVNFLKASNAKLEEARICHLEQNEKLQKENEELKKDLEWAINELDRFISDDDCPYYSENIKRIKDKWFKGEKNYYGHIKVSGPDGDK